MHIHASELEEQSGVKGEADGALGKRTLANRGPGRERLLRAQSEVGGQTGKGGSSPCSGELRVRVRRGEAVPLDHVHFLCHMRDEITTSAERKRPWES